jgi:hypothetical protein
VLLVVIDSSENSENPEQPDSWPPELNKPVAMTARSPLPRACGGCGFGEGTFAGVSGNDEDAPKRAVRLSWVERVKPTRCCPSSLALSTDGNREKAVFG